MRLLFLFALTSSTMLGILALLAMPVGAMLNPSPTILLELAECSYQCWNGITAGDTPINEVETVMEALNYRRVRRNPLLGGGLAAVFTLGECNVVVYHSHLVESIYFPTCHQITLGDMILVLGTPDAIIHRNALDYELRWRNQRGLFIHVENWSSPHSQPMRITLGTPIDFSSERRQGRWRGFMSVRRYCAIEQPNGFSTC
jgi:hypothetical protein